MLKTLIALSSVAAVFAVAPAAHAANDYYLKLDGIAGETVVGKTTDAIAIHSFAWEIENKTSIGSASGGAGAGKAQFNELTVTKNVDSTSPALLTRVGTGQHLAAMELVARKAGQPAQISMRYCFQPVFVTSVKHTGAQGDEGTTEEVTFTYGAMSETYAKQNPNGSTSNVASAWNQMTNASTMLMPDGDNACGSSRF